MDIWQTILIALGGNVTALAILGWLAKSFVNQLLAKDVEKFKSDLKVEADKDIEEFKSNLKVKADKDIEEFKSNLKAEADKDIEEFKSNLKAEADKDIEKLRSKLEKDSIEHQVRFSKLHERRADIIAKTYALLQKLRIALLDYVQLNEAVKESNRIDKREIAGKMLNEFDIYYQENKIFLPKSSSSIIDDIFKEIKENFYDFWCIVDKPRTKGDSEYTNWINIFNKIKDEIPNAISDLENNFRILLGDSVV